MTPLRTPLLPGKKVLGPSTSRKPRDPRTGLGAQEWRREGEVGSVRGLGLGGTGGTWGTWDREYRVVCGVVGGASQASPEGARAKPPGGLTIGVVAESQQEQEDAQEGSGRGHLGAAWVGVRGAAAVQRGLRGLHWASGCGR